jgi:hypothetical protein
MIEEVLRDLRVALRLLRKNTTFNVALRMAIAATAHYDTR